MTNQEKVDFLEYGVLKYMEKDLEAELEELEINPLGADQVDFIYQLGYQAAIKCVRRISIITDAGGDIEAIFKNASKEKEEAVNE